MQPLGVENRNQEAESFQMNRKQGTARLVVVDFVCAACRVGEAFTASVVIMQSVE